jgi:hypothetical protein
MYICNNCHSVFDEPCKDYDRSTGTNDTTCPECGSDDIEDAAICPVCGNWRADNNIAFETEHCCADCAKRLKSAVADALNVYLCTLNRQELNAVSELVEGKDMIEFWRMN